MYLTVEDATVLRLVTKQTEESTEKVDACSSSVLSSDPLWLRRETSFLKRCWPISRLARTRNMLVLSFGYLPMNGISRRRESQSHPKSAGWIMFSGPMIFALGGSSYKTSSRLNSQ